jgi:hypothetical protein
VAEGGGLLNRYTLSRRIEGSNPSVSAIAPSDTAHVRPKTSTTIESYGPRASTDVRHPPLISTHKTYIEAYIERRGRHLIDGKDIPPALVSGGEERQARHAP